MGTVLGGKHEFAKKGRIYIKVQIHDADKNDFPNYALMKLSAWHKSQGDSVEWFTPLEPCDRVYSSKVFTFTEIEPMLPENFVGGGTGYGLLEELPKDVDDMFPDYSIYPKVDYAIGFLTRGCIRSCPWCIVPKKEGKIRPYRDWRDIKRPDSRDIVFMDNNVLASDYGIEQMQSMIGHKVRVDFNQGLDARLITPEIAEILSRLKWIRQIRMACDTDAMIDVIADKVNLLERYGVKPRRIFVYMLVKDIESAERRAIALRNLGVDPFAQPYRDFENNIEPSQEQKRLARWVNRKEIFKTCDTFGDYKGRAKHG